MRKTFPLVREAVATVMPVERLRWVSFSHFESDECGALNEWLAVAPQAAPLCGQIGAMLSIADIADLIAEMAQEFCAPLRARSSPGSPPRRRW